MQKMIPAAKKLLVGAVAVGALSLGTAGLAGAAAPTSTPSAATPSAARHFNCANAPKVLARIQKGEADIAAGLPKLTAAQARAAKADHTKRAAALQKRITRFESTRFKDRLARITSAIEARCNVSAPSTGN